MNAAFDIRSALPSISTPTLVLHRTGDLIYPVEHGRYLGEHIPDARFVELPGTDHLPFWEEPDIILDLIEEFVTGTKTVDVDRFDRVLATVLSPTSSTRLPMRPTSVIARGGNVSMTTTPW